MVPGESLVVDREGTGRDRKSHFLINHLRSSESVAYEGEQRFINLEKKKKKKLRNNSY